MAKFVIPAQALTAGESVILNNTQMKSCAIYHDNGTAPVTVRGSGCICNPARYAVSVHVINAEAVSAPVQFGIYVDGELVADSLIGLPTVTVGDTLSGDVTTEITAAGSSRITLRAITDANLTGGNVIITRKS